jgi:prepilin-type N-terminal cleavage/methylation domain-containing protein
MAPLSVSPLLSSARRSGERGFTLIELVVAMSAGLMVSMAALILSRNATRFFQNEARISSTQLAVTLGMNRLTADLQRAAFLGTRNNATSKTLCTQGMLPASLSALAGISFRIGGSVATHPADLAQSIDPQNTMNPDSAMLSGSYDATERFAVAWAYIAGGQTTVDLQLDGAIARLRQSATQAGQSLSQALTPIFKPGRFLHFIDNGAGQGDVWGIIDSFSVGGPVGAEKITVVLLNSPAIPQKTQLTTCGLSAGANRGVYVSVVSRIQYDLRSLKTDAKYGPLVSPGNPAAAAITGEAGRTELVRTELDSTGTEMPGSLELVAELVVDLKFGVVKAPAAGSANVFNPVMTAYPFDDPQVANTPELIRGVRVRLATRGRVPDRENQLAASGRNYRFAVLQPPIRERWTRLRTLYSTVALPNQADFSP